MNWVKLIQDNKEEICAKHKEADLLAMRNTNSTYAVIIDSDDGYVWISEYPVGESPDIESVKNGTSKIITTFSYFLFNPLKMWDNDKLVSKFESYLSASEVEDFHKSLKQNYNWCVGDYVDTEWLDCYNSFIYDKLIQEVLTDIETNYDEYFHERVDYFIETLKR